MKVFAYCAASFEESVRKAAGVDPFLSPPCTSDEDSLFRMRAGQLEGYDFLYFKLHGLLAEPYWYGDGWVDALDADTIRGADLGGAVVFVANCHLWYDARHGGDPRQQAPMLFALLDAGARAVVGGPGKNYARKVSVDGADLLGRGFRRLCGFGLSPGRAFRLARLGLSMRKEQTDAIVDALRFRIFEQGKPEQDFGELSRGVRESGGGL